MRLVLALSLVAALVAAGAAAAAAPGSPNDPGWPGEWGIRLVGLPAVWASDTGKRPVVATVDTGADASFPDLKEAVVGGWNILDNTSETTDTAGHGTDVALVIAANAGNSYGLAGACPMCQVMPVKISTDGTATPHVIAAGIRWAVDHGATVIVVSAAAAGGGPDPETQTAVDYAGAHGAVILAAAGNDGATTLHYPAALRGVVSVAGTDPNDQLYPWSTRGNWVDLAAPGCIYGDSMCGTSYGPPLVAAAVGVLMAASPSVTAVQAVNALRATAVRIPGIAGGRIDVHAAAEMLGIADPVVVQAARKPGPQQLSLQAGAFTSDFRTTLTVGAGPLTVLFNRPNAIRCAMTLRSKDALYLTWRSTPNELDISTRVAAGTYTLAVHCTGKRRLPYSVTVNSRPLAR